MPPEPDDHFSITVTVAPGRERADLVLSGEVDMPARPQLAEVVDQLAITAPHTVVVDLAAVSYGGSVLVNWRDKRIAVEFQGVYRDAMVFVNGAYAGQRRNGYTPFRVPLDAHLRYGETNTIRVEARAHQDSRW